jgi:hypothetical protein
VSHPILEQVLSHSVVIFDVLLLLESKVMISDIGDCLIGFVSKMSVFWVVAPYSLVWVYQRFRGLYCLHDYRPDDGGSTDLYKVGRLIPVYTALQPRRQTSSYSQPWGPEVIFGFVFPEKLNDCVNCISPDGDGMKVILVEITVVKLITFTCPFFS